jgi:hypothetical protein
MANRSLESRVARLESQVDRLLRLISNPPDPAQRITDLDRVTGFFGDDPVIKRIMKEALKYREKNRQEARRSQKKVRRSRS